MQELTKRQKRILNYLKDEIGEGRAPSFRDIMREFRFRSIKAVSDHLHALEKKGYIRKNPGIARGIEILGFKKLLSIELPVLGRIAAGSPILSEQNIEGTIAIDKSWVKGKNSFVLKVQGDSMVGAGIFDGDYAIIKQDYTAKDNDIVVAIVDNEATLKRFFRKDDKIILKPENPAMEPIIIEKGKSNIRIIGKATGVYRQVN